MFQIKKKHKKDAYFGSDQFRSKCIIGAYYLKNENQGKELCTPFYY